MIPSFPHMAKTLEHVDLVGNELALAFTDGGELFLPLPMLRRACPCANCQGEPDVMGRIVKPKVEHKETAFTLLRYETVGGYALRLHWADGHNTGLYTFDYLEKLSLLP